MIPDAAQGSLPLVQFSTPLVTIGVLVEVLRERFKETSESDPDVPWHWTNDPKTTPIFIESGWNENLEARNVRPGIWVDRDQNVYQRVAIGDQDQLPTIQRYRLEMFYGKGETDIIIECTAQKRGESMIIGSIVQDFLHMSSDVIQAFFGFHDISPILLGRTVPFEKDNQLWNTPVNFRVTYEIRWATAPIVTTFNSLYTKIAQQEDPVRYFREISLRSKL